VRALIVRWTAVVALAVAGVVTMMDASTGAPWPVLVLRTGIAVGIVALAGWGVGYVLMRSALRRHYEQSRIGQADVRPRSHR
jgi:drug/metabolite transporter (DMT)-like permease